MHDIIYMDQNWTTLDLGRFFTPRNEVTSDQINKMLKKQDSFGNDPTVVGYDEEEIRALEEYCKQHGIIGVNFGSMSPHSILSMLQGKSRNEIRTTTNRGILHG